MFLTSTKGNKKIEVANHFRPNEEIAHLKGVLSYISIISVQVCINFLIQYVLDIT